MQLMDMMWLKSGVNRNKGKGGGAWLAQPVEHTTLALKTVNQSTMMDVQIT